MKAKFPNYRIKGIAHIKLKPKDKQTLNSFMELIKGSSCEKRANNIRTILLTIYDVSEIGFDKWNLENFRKFLNVLNNSGKPNSTTNSIKKILKRFLKENYSDWEIRFKKFQDEGVKTKKELNEVKINKKVLIKPEELDLLLRDVSTIY